MPARKEIHVELPEHLHAALRDRARREQRSLGGETRLALIRHLGRDGERPAETEQAEP